MLYYKINILEKLKEKGITTTKIRKEKLIPEASLTAIRNNKPIHWTTIEKICDLLECQPGDILGNRSEDITKEQDSNQEKDNIYNKGYLYFKEKSDKIEWSNFLCFCDELEGKEIDLDIIETNIVKYWRAYINSDQVK